VRIACCKPCFVGNDCLAKKRGTKWEKTSIIARSTPLKSLWQYEEGLSSFIAPASCNWVLDHIAIYHDPFPSHIRDSWNSIIPKSTWKKWVHKTACKSLAPRSLPWFHAAWWVWRARTVQWPAAAPTPPTTSTVGSGPKHRWGEDEEGDTWNFENPCVTEETPELE